MTAITLPQHIASALQTHPMWNPSSSVEAAWDLSSGIWGGILYGVDDAYVPFTWDDVQKLRLWEDDRTEHMMEALRCAADRCDEIWMNLDDHVA